LYTTKNVLDSLSKGTIDFGLFAVSNTLGGIVDETIEVLGDYKFEIVTQITLNIRHFLMKRRDVTTDQITKIIAHPQVLKQCEENLSTKYPRLAKISGGGDLIDTAKAAQALHVKKLSYEHAILGPRVLAELYAFDIIDSNLQDREDNRTTFLLVKR
jgi:prephenate dehydratase